jgi:hypothetical protein
MRRSRKHQVIEHVGVKEEALDKCDENALDSVWLGDAHPNHQVHAFILRFVQ